MYPRKILLSAFVSVFCLFGITSLLADIDVPDYQKVLKPDFVASGESYKKLQTNPYTFDHEVNNIIIGVDANKSKDAMLRGYARFKYAKTGKWTRYMPFDGEYHFSSVDTLAEYQLMFIVRDPEKGDTRINAVTMNGYYIPENEMEYFVQKPMPFTPAKVTAKPDIESREDWGAKPPKYGYAQHDPQRIIVHHSYIPNQSQYKGAASIRGIQNYHMYGEHTKWNDIGYHFLIGPDGVIYQGRPETVVGAHCSPNTNSVGICLIGDYDPNKDKITPVMENALIKLMAWVASYYRIDVRANLYGHCDFSPKSCPGKTVYVKLPEYRDLILQATGEIK
ncbi:MAG: peptidoglycan recognition protein family protein [Candidatus Rifleibacteriota bacterium]